MTGFNFDSCPNRSKCGQKSNFVPLVSPDLLLVARLTQLGFQLSEETALSDYFEVLIMLPGRLFRGGCYRIEEDRHSLVFSTLEAAYSITSNELIVETTITVFCNKEKEGWARGWALPITRAPEGELRVNYYWAHPGSLERAAIEAAGYCMAYPINCEQPHEMAPEIHAAANWYANQLRKSSQLRQEEGRWNWESEELIQAFELALKQEMAKKISSTGFSFDNPPLGRQDRRISPYDPAVQAAANLVGIPGIEDKLGANTVWIDPGCVAVSPFTSDYLLIKAIYRKPPKGWQQFFPWASENWGREQFSRLFNFLFLAAEDF